ncbi:hypothetical protein KEM55_006716 [Ascosphaera atra]|nr:hypothetical protein KEM55_006716 [Ascosphaera atra]
MNVVLGTEPDARGDDPAHWNVVQNNGIRASQTIPHVHYHIIPRPPVDYTSSSFDGGNRSKTAGKSSGVIVFGKGKRDDLDDDEAEALVRALKEELCKEIVRIKDVEGVDLWEDFEIGTHKGDEKAKL